MFHKTVVSVFVYLCCFNVVIAEKNQDTVYFRIEDFPSHGDLQHYLKPLERVINFSNKFRDKVNLNWNFGLFLATVNLHSAIQNGNLSPELQNYFKKLIKTTSKTMDYAKKIKKSTFDSRANSLFNNITAWPGQLKKLEISELSSSHKHPFPKWSTYYREVNNTSKWTPNAKLSDSCIEALSQNHKNDGSYLSSCQVPDNCYKMLISGTNFGYALTHRLMFLELAYFGQRCVVFSEDQDEYMKRRFCKIMFNEAEYIADHGYKHPDLMLEQITLCSLNGHADFLRRSWLNHLLRYQTRLGCFGTLPPTKARQAGRNREYKRRADNETDENDMMYGTCGTHITALGVSTYAAAVRLILEDN